MDRYVGLLELNAVRPYKIWGVFRIVLESNHYIDISSLSLVRQLKTYRELNSTEFITIYENTDIINSDKDSIPQSLVWKTESIP